MSINNQKYSLLFTQEQQDKIREDYLNNFLSIRDIAKKYNIKSKYWIQYVLLKDITRNHSQGILIGHKRYPENFKQTEETKEKIRQARLKYMEEHPEDTAWRKRNKPSYPEECFIKFLQEKGYDKKFLIEREKSVFPYFIDFAFVQCKLAIEIDGSQHILDEKRRLKDLDKDYVLQQNGWKVLRISENLVKTDWSIIEVKINEMINTDVVYDKIGIIKAPKTKIKAKRNKNGRTEKQVLCSLQQRKVNRPSKENLLKDIQSRSFTAIAKDYGVSDNAIRKWCKQYGIPHKKRDIKNLDK